MEAEIVVAAANGHYVINIWDTPDHGAGLGDLSLRLHAVLISLKP